MKQNSRTPLIKTQEIKNQQATFEALVSSSKEPMLVLIRNQNYPDILKTWFLLAGFYCIK